jgi:hypothetical protein
MYIMKKIQGQQSTDEIVVRMLQRQSLASGGDAQQRQHNVSPPQDRWWLRGCWTWSLPHLSFVEIGAEVRKDELGAHLPAKAWSVAGVRLMHRFQVERGE